MLRESSQSLGFPVKVWTVHFLICQIVASLAYHFGTSRADHPEGDPSWAYGGNADWLPGNLTGWSNWLVAPWRLWDGSWYRLVSVYGYTPEQSASAAFFPLYPGMMRFGHNLTGLPEESIGYLIANLAFLGALIILYRLVAAEFDHNIAERTLWALALFPTAFFFSAIYTESLFLLWAVLTLYSARRGNWALAGVTGLLAALTRSAGLMLLAPMGVLFLQQFGWNPKRWFPQAIPAALPLAAPAIFGLVLQRNGLQFFDWINQQWQWNRFTAMPWETFSCTLQGCTAQVRFISGETGPAEVRPIQWGWIGDLIQQPSWELVTSFEWRDTAARSDVFEFICTVLALLLAILAWKRIPLYFHAYIWPPFLVPLFSPSSVHPLMSMPRFILPLFPLFVVLAMYVRPGGISRVAIGLSTIGLIVLTMQFASWYWVG